jgi:hypothetical protein
MLCIEDWWPFYGRAIKALSYGSAIKQPILITQGATQSSMQSIEDQP